MSLTRRHIRPRLACLLAATVLVAGIAAASAAAGPPAAGPLHGAWLERAAGERPAEPVKVWVFLTDKGNADAESRGRALAEVADGWSPAVRERRAGAPADVTDLPVHETYVEVLARAGFRVHRRSRWLNAVSVTLPAGRVGELAGFDFVRFVQPVLVKLARNVPAPPRGADPVAGPLPPGVTAGAVGGPIVGAEAAWYGLSVYQNDNINAVGLHRLGYTGAGVRVMVLDTGFKTGHPAFATCTDLAGQYDFVQEDGVVDNQPGDSASQMNHGTGVWGTAGGFAPGELIGPAFGATFYLAKTEDVSSETQAEEDNYVAALEWADTLGVHVASASLAYLSFDDGSTYAPGDLDGDTAVISVAVDLAVAKGICVVNSAANAGPSPSSIWTPADADSVIAVGALDTGNTVAVFSSRGPTADGRIKPEVCARGVDVRWAQAWSDGYGGASGTSLAAPLVGGLAALLKEAHPGWSGHDIRLALMQTADNAGAPNNDVGWGLVDGLAALTHGGATPAPPRTPLPFALADPPDSAVVGTSMPKLAWNPSADLFGDGALEYTLHWTVNGGPVQVAPTADTCLVLPVSLAPADTLDWWVEAVNPAEGHVRKSYDTRTVIGGASLDVPPGPAAGRVRLGAAFPNPMRGGTRIPLSAPAGEPVSLRVVTVGGRVVRTLDAVGTGGELRLAWDGRDEAGRSVPPGVYFLRVDGFPAAARKIIRLP